MGSICTNIQVLICAFSQSGKLGIRRTRCISYSAMRTQAINGSVVRPKTNLPFVLHIVYERQVIFLWYKTVKYFKSLCPFQSLSLICWDTARINPEGDTIMLNLELPVSTVSFAASCLALWKPRDSRSAIASSRSSTFIRIIVHSPLPCVTST